jgi:5,10-methylene-tetrahydrofolate dehydrogenase/methenyl tetrahydrofolate cyclohydrolase
MENKTETCKWCSKEKDVDAIRCPNCGKLKKDIYEDKIKCYTACLIGGLLLGIGIAKHTDYGESSTGKTLLIIGGVLAAIAGVIYYVKVSQKLKTYWWM